MENLSKSILAGFWIFHYTYIRIGIGIGIGIGIENLANQAPFIRFAKIFPLIFPYAYNNLLLKLKNCNWLELRLLVFSWPLDYKEASKMLIIFIAYVQIKR